MNFFSFIACFDLIEFKILWTEFVLFSKIEYSEHFVIGFVVIHFIDLLFIHFYYQSERYQFDFLFFFFFQIT